MGKLTDDTGQRLHYDTAEEYRQAVDDAEQFIVDSLGIEAALEAISKALDYDTKENIYEYIIRVYDLEEVDQ